MEKHYESIQNMVSFKFIPCIILVLCNQIHSPSIGDVVADYFELDPDNVDNPEVSQIAGVPSG